MKKENIGSSSDDWLREEGIYEEVSKSGCQARFRSGAAIGSNENEPP